VKVGTAKPESIPHPDSTTALSRLGAVIVARATIFAMQVRLKVG
jgi:hypothetical protein